MLLTQCFQNLFEHEIFFFFPRKTCLTDFRNVWSESTSAIGITWTCVQIIAPNPRLCTLSSLQIRGKHCCWGQCRKGWGTDRSPLTPATSDKHTCLSMLSTAVMNTTTKSSLGGGRSYFSLQCSGPTPLRREGSKDRNLNARTEAESTDECCFPRLAQSAFLNYTGPPAQGGDYLQYTGPSTAVTEMPYRLACRQSDGSSSQLRFLFPDSTSLC